MPLLLTVDSYLTAPLMMAENSEVDEQLKDQLEEVGSVQD